jgi:hypothetical protein
MVCFAAASRAFFNAAQFGANLSASSYFSIASRVLPCFASTSPQAFNGSAQGGLFGSPPSGSAGGAENMQIAQYEVQMHAASLRFNTTPVDAGSRPTWHRPLSCGRCLPRRTVIQQRRRCSGTITCRVMQTQASVPTILTRFVLRHRGSLLPSGEGGPTKGAPHRAFCCLGLPWRCFLCMFARSPIYRLTCGATHKFC